MTSLWFLFYSSAIPLWGKCTDISLIQVLPRFGNSKTMETYTLISRKSLANTKGTLDFIIKSQNTVYQFIKSIKTNNIKKRNTADIH